MPAEVTAVVLCDDARKEVSGKDILIGVYGGGINVQAYPTILHVAYWIEMATPEVGKFRGHITIETPSGNPPIELDFDVDVREAGSSVLVIGGLPMALERDGHVVASVRFDDGELKEIKRTPVRRPALPRPH